MPLLPSALPTRPRGRRVAALGLALLGVQAAACAGDRVTAPAATRERAGELRLGGQWAGLRLQFRGAVDSVLAGQAGAGGYYASPVINGQALLLQPKGDSLATTIRFRVFATAGTDAATVDVTVPEGSRPDGTVVQAPSATVLWLR